MKIQLLTTLLAVLLLSPFSQAAKMPDAVLSMPGNNAINLVYSPQTGNIALDNRVENPADRSMILDLTSLQIKSPGHLLVDGGPPDFAPISGVIKPTSFTGVFDLYTLNPAPGDPQKAFKLVPDGFGGNIETFANAGPGRSGSELMADFEFDGSFKGGGDLDSTTINIVVVPEPASLCLMLVTGVLGVPLMRRI